jgi:murein endopeptidase
MPRWTPEARFKQSELIRQVRPWEKSTGPRTPEGKAISSKNRGGYSEACFPGYGFVRVGSRRYKRLRKDRDRLLRKMWAEGCFKSSV